MSVDRLAPAVRTGSCPSTRALPPAGSMASQRGRAFAARWRSCRIARPARPPPSAAASRSGPCPPPAPALGSRSTSRRSDRPRAAPRCQCRGHPGARNCACRPAEPLDAVGRSRRTCTPSSCLGAPRRRSIAWYSPISPRRTGARVRIAAGLARCRPPRIAAPPAGRPGRHPHRWWWRWWCWWCCCCCCWRVCRVEVAPQAAPPVPAAVESSPSPLATFALYK